MLISDKDSNYIIWVDCCDVLINNVIIVIVVTSSRMCVFTYFVYDILTKHIKNGISNG